MDLFLQTPLGLTALAFALTGYVIGILQGALLRSAWWVTPLLGGLGGILGGLIFIGIGAIVGQEQLFALRSLRVVLLVRPLRRDRGPDRVPNCGICGARAGAAYRKRDEQARMVRDCSEDLRRANARPRSGRRPSAVPRPCSRRSRHRPRISSAGESVVIENRVRMSIVGVIALALFGALFARLWYLQVAATSEYAAAAQSNSVRTINEPPIRGRILDDEGRVLVDNRVANVITVDRKLSHPERAMVVNRLAELLSKPATEIRKKLEDPRVSPYTDVPVAVDVAVRETGVRE